MLLQDIFKEEHLTDTELYGITLDADSSKIEFSSPPDHFETLGFVLELDDSGMISDNLLDIIINYKMTNLPILIEVPSNWFIESKVDLKYIVSLSHNVDFMISLLPPGHPLVGNTINEEQYANLIDDFMKELLTKPNFDKFICPVSNFMEYLMLEKLIGKDSVAIKNFKPDNKYVVDNFSSILNHASSDLFKSRIRATLYDFYEGEENFNLIANTIFKGVQEKSSQIFTQHVQNYMLSQKQ